jgi:hypothetical protein
VNQARDGVEAVEQEMRSDAGLKRFDTRFRFGELIFDDYDWVDTDLLLQYVGFRTGDPYQSAYLRSLQASLSGTNYFANVEVVPRRDLADDELRVPIELHATPRKTQRWEVGLGYGTDTGPRIRLSTEFRRLNRAGHFADLDARISTVEQSITARYNIPVGVPYPSLWTVTGRYGNIEWVTSKTLQGIAGLSFAHMRGDVREVLSLRYQHDDFSVAADTAVSNLTQPVAAWSWSKADDPLYAAYPRCLVGYALGFFRGGQSHQVDNAILGDNFYPCPLDIGAPQQPGFDLGGDPGIAGPCYAGTRGSHFHFVVDSTYAVHLAHHVGGSRLQFFATDLAREQNVAIDTHHHQMRIVEGVIGGVNVDDRLGLDVVVFDHLGDRSLIGFILDGVRLHGGEKTAAGAEEDTQAACH